MNKDTIVHVDLYDNPLTEKEGDYVGRVSINGSAHNAECAQRIIDKRSEYRLETILNIMDLVDQEKRALLAEGKSVIDGVGQFLPTISGSFDGPEAPFDAEKHKLSVSFTMGKALRDSLAQAERHENLDYVILQRAQARKMMQIQYEVLYKDQIIKKQRLLAIGSALLFLLVSALLFLLYQSKRKKERTNRLLYEKTKQLLDLSQAQTERWKALATGQDSPAEDVPMLPDENSGQEIRQRIFRRS